MGVSVMSRFVNKHSPEYKIMSHFGISLFNADQVAIMMEEGGFDFERWDDKTMLKHAERIIDDLNTNGDWIEEGKPYHDGY